MGVELCNFYLLINYCIKLGKRAFDSRICYDKYFRSIQRHPVYSVSTLNLFVFNCRCIEILVNRYKKKDHSENFMYLVS